MTKSKELQQRTLRQNKSLHLYFQMLADELNDAGYDMRVVLKPEIDIPWTCESVKSHLWKPIQKAMYSKLSTTEMDTTEPSKVYETLNRFLAEKFHISVPFPSSEPDMLEYLIEQEKHVGIKRNY